MKKNFSINTLLAVFAVIFLAGCYSDTINSLKTFKFQLPIDFDQTYHDRTAPDTSIDFTNLEKYKDFRDNKDRIKKAEILSFNYWMDTLVVGGTPFKPYDPGNKYYFDYTKNQGNNVLEFTFIKFYLVFAKPAYPYNNDPYDSRNWQLDPLSEWHLLGEFKNVNVANYFRMPQNILQVDETTMQVISDAIKVRPQFFTVTEYSATTGGEKKFDYIRSGHNIIIRFEVDL